MDRERGGLTQIGKYPVLRKLGAGATSEVYLCHDPFNARDVAVKVAPSQPPSDAERGRLQRKLFLTEASLAGKLQHPHICQIFDAASDEQLSYVVMEYVDGGTLEKHCRPDALLPVERVLEIAFKCARALEFAQRLGITHRDIKPANILHSRQTDVKITDFGAALLASGGGEQVMGIGSPAYMSPEQLKDQPLDHQTDIYSLGVVMYHLLTGRLPFRADSDFSLIYQITNVEAEAPGAYRPEIPEAVAAIVRRAMAKERGARYREWAELSRDLTEVVRGPRRAAPTQEFADSEKFETLRRLPFFHRFSDVELWEVARLSTWRRAAAGELLMKEGEPGDFFCILAEGQVKVTRKGKLLNLLRAGQCFGEMAYLSSREPVRGADVAVMSEASIISVPTAQLAQASDACRHQFDRAFMEILVERLTMANLRLSGV
jgi:eukaryotic-like serine/threonine-protein kinase